MAQDTTPSIIMYQGGTNTFPIPFDKGYYGEVKVLFVRRGATGYEYEPASSNYVVNGRLYAWGTGSDYIYTHTPTPAVGAPIYNDQDADSGKQVEATAGQTITVEGVSYIRATQHDISNHLILTWNGEELTMDDYICIGRDTERGQPYSLPNNQKHIEGALDNIERQVQELKDKTDNALVVDPTHTIDANKMGPIDWLETIVRSTDKTARAIRYHNGYLQFSLEDPDVPLDQKTWTSILNTINVTTIREWYDEEKNEYRLQYSKDNGVSWKELPLNFSSIPGLEERLATIESEQVVLSSGVAANTSAVQRNQIDINTNTVSISSLRLDMNAADAVLRESINANADKITTKQDKLNAGDNIIISGNVISATSGGAGLDFIVIEELPETGQKGVVYLMAKDGEAPDVYDEYVWITATQTFELIGSTKVDLSDYATKEDLENIDALPDQAGNAGKFLTTDGTAASWSDKPLVNKASDPSSVEDSSVIIYGIPNKRWCSTVVGAEASNANGYGTVVGYKASGGPDTVVIGMKANADSGIAIGKEASSKSTWSIAIGDKASANKASSIALGENAKTEEEHTFVVGLGWDGNNSRYANYKLLNFDGTIPTDRMSATAGTTGQVLTKTDAGMEWQDPSGGTTITLKEYDE